MSDPHNPHSGYYECHITLETRYKDQVEVIAKNNGFKVSSLKGDEIMGDDVKIYCTGHAKEEMQMRGKMASLTADLWNAKIPYLRRKIEHIIFDERKVPNEPTQGKGEGEQESDVQLFQRR